MSEEQKELSVACQSLGDWTRTHTCGELTGADNGAEFCLMGWVQYRRDHGGLIFVDLRDRFGLTQIVFSPEYAPEAHEQAGALRSEYVLAMKGKVRPRPEGMVNPNLKTGEVEVVVSEWKLLNTSKTPPFQIEDRVEAGENLRLQWRYLDLRRPRMARNLALRSRTAMAIRNELASQGFLEVETPILTKSTPEGARDYLVPARNHPGKFYALPQAPQQFKQLLMTSGFDRYFQIAPCFRGEDARADRSPGEFYQLDMEMAFATQDDVFAVLEDVLPPVFTKYGKYKAASAAPFRRISFRESMDRYGSDKPDLRIDLELTDAACLQDCGFEPFAGQTVKAVVVPDFHKTRKFIDKLCAEAEMLSGGKAYWFRLDENGELVGGISKFVAEKKDEVIEKLGLTKNSFVALAAGKYGAAVKTAGVLRKLLGAQVEGHMDAERYEFCWIVDFPMYEIGEESGELEFCHNPFSMPQGGLEALERAHRGEIDPLTINAYQYDLVCNGVELSSGAVRNHDPEIMIRAFELVGLGEADVKAKFPAMYNAFCYGAPPHAGIAPGVDRMVMLLAGEDSIREVIPFPMNKNAQDLMMDAPSAVDPKQLADVHIAIVEDK